MYFYVVPIYLRASEAAERDEVGRWPLKMPTWKERERILCKIKEDIFGAALLDPERLDDVDRIEQLNTWYLNNNEFYGLVKRAAAEVLLDRDLNNSAGGERTRRSAKSNKKSEGRDTARESSGQHTRETGSKNDKKVRGTERKPSELFLFLMSTDRANQ